MGIYDRDYYREDSRWSNPFARSQGTFFLCLLYFLMFIAQIATTMDERPGQREQKEGLTETLRLDVEKTIKEGEVWRVVSYALVHDNIIRVIFTVVFLVWIGHQVEDLYSTKEYLAFFLFTSLLGGIVYTVIGALAPNMPPLAGPSGSVTAILILFALHYPSWRFFFLPIWLVVAIYALSDVAGLAQGHSNPARVAVHLAGAAFALAYHTYTLRILNWLPSRKSSKTARRSQPKLRVRQQRPEPEPAAAAAHPAAIGTGSAPSSGVDEHLEAKLDEVLEKVQKHGKESLTESEREVLLKASEIYKKRRQSS